MQFLSTIKLFTIYYYCCRRPCSCQCQLNVEQWSEWFQLQASAIICPICDSCVNRFSTSKLLLFNLPYFLGAREGPHLSSLFIGRQVRTLRALESAPPQPAPQGSVRSSDRMEQAIRLIFPDSSIMFHPNKPQTMPCEVGKTPLVSFVQGLMGKNLSSAEVRAVSQERRVGSSGSCHGIVPELSHPLQ